VYPLAIPIRIFCTLIILAGRQARCFSRKHLIFSGLARWNPSLAICGIADLLLTPWMTPLSRSCNSIVQQAYRVRTESCAALRDPHRSSILAAELISSKHSLLCPLPSLFSPPLSSPDTVSPLKDLTSSERRINPLRERESLIRCSLDKDRRGISRPDILRRRVVPVAHCHRYRDAFARNSRLAAISGDARFDK